MFVLVSAPLLRVLSGETLGFTAKLAPQWARRDAPARGQQQTELRGIMGKQNNKNRANKLANNTTLSSEPTQGRGRDRPTAPVQLFPHGHRAIRDEFDFLGAVLRDDRAPLADSSGADLQRPRDIRGTLKVINNVLLEHETPFTLVKTGSQPRCMARGLTSVDMDKHSTQAERLESAMKAAGVHASQLARECDVSAAAVHKWLNGGKMNADNLAAAARALGVREEWLRTGKLPREREHRAEEQGVDQVIGILQNLREPLAALTAAIDQLSHSRPEKKKPKAAS